MATWQFQRSREHYAALYNVSPRTISRWAAKGFPLDDEAGTRAILEAGSAGPGTQANGPRTARSDSAGQLGLAASIKRLQTAEAEAHADFLAAVESGDERLAAARQRQWLALSEQLRKVEISTPEAEAANNALISVSEVSAALSELFIIHRQDLENLGRRVAGELVGKDEVSISEVINRETAVLIETLYACPFLEATDE